MAAELVKRTEGESAEAFPCLTGRSKLFGTSHWPALLGLGVSAAVDRRSESHCCFIFLATAVGLCSVVPT
jgi:hypothetical protein